MSVLIDPPSWPAHGRSWSHLVSDSALEELHALAQQAHLSRRAFDVDHYDVPQEMYGVCLAAGAVAVSSRELLTRLSAAGLRVRQVDKPAKAAQQRAEHLRSRWLDLGDRLGVAVPAATDHPTGSLAAWTDLGEELLRRWSEPHRHYHDQHHLDDVLGALDVLRAGDTPVGPAVQLAAWFHDAVYLGHAGKDEAASADLAARRLGSAGVAVETIETVRRLVLATAPGTEQPQQPGGAEQPPQPDGEQAALLDADLSIFATTPKRYAAYVRGVRREYARYDDEVFATGRAAVVQAYLERPWIYATAAGRRRWEQVARANLTAESASLAIMPTSLATTPASLATMPTSLATTPASLTAESTSLIAESARLVAESARLAAESASPAAAPPLGP